MKVVGLLFILVTSVHAFQVLVPTCSCSNIASRRASVMILPAASSSSSSSEPQDTDALAEEASKSLQEEEDIELECIVADDEWLRLSIQLAQVVMEEVKKFSAEVMENEEVQKLGNVAKEIEAYVVDEVNNRLRETVPETFPKPQNELGKFAADLVKYIETKVGEVTGEADYRLGDYSQHAKKELGDISKEVESRINHAIAEFSDGCTNLVNLKIYVEKQVDTRVQQAKDDSANYEFYKFKNELEKRQKEYIQAALDPEEYHELRRLANKAKDFASSAKGFITNFVKKRIKKTETK